jgi:hypothetical protein
MKLPLLSLSVFLITQVPARTLAAPNHSATPKVLADAKILLIQKTLAETVINTQGFPREMSLKQFLAALEGKLPKGKSIPFRIDEPAFGKQLQSLTAARIKFPHPLKNVEIASVLRRALVQVSRTEKADYTIRPTGVWITPPHLAAIRMVYDFRDLLPEIPWLLPDLKRAYPNIDQNLETAKPAAVLLRYLLTEVDLQPWESIQVRNDVRLVVQASSGQHEQIAEHIERLRRLADLAVVMNARLYEVDRAFFVKHFAPLFAADADSEERPRVIPPDGALFKKIYRQKVVQESEFLKIRPRRQVPFFSRETVFRFGARPKLKKADRTTPGVGLIGVSFEVRPLVSPDRRYLRLRITQKVVQFAGINRTKTLDIATGKEVEVETPNLCKSTVTGTVQIPDGNPILMPVAYPPPGRGKEDKVWLLVARPVIWIEAEVQVRKISAEEYLQGFWQSAHVAKDEEPVPEKRLAWNEDTRQILQAIVKDVLTNPQLKHSREFYGTPGDKTFALVDGHKLGWPREFMPETHGHKLVKVCNDPFAEERRVLGIRLDKFDLKQKKADVLDAPVHVVLCNAGGDANGAVIGGCQVYYLPHRAGKGWTVELVGINDP